MQLMEKGNIIFPLTIISNLRRSIAVMCARQTVTQIKPKTSIKLERDSHPRPLRSRWSESIN